MRLDGQSPRPSSQLGASFVLCPSRLSCQRRRTELNEWPRARLQGYMLAPRSAGEFQTTRGERGDHKTTRWFPLGRGVARRRARVQADPTWARALAFHPRPYGGSGTGPIPHRVPPALRGEGRALSRTSRHPAWSRARGPGRRPGVGLPRAQPPQFPRLGPAGAQEVALGRGPRPAPSRPRLSPAGSARAGGEGGRQGERAGGPEPGRRR